ncbi:hypothetical protein BX616_002173 [Lobosporangium transversale]|uniref:FAD-binding domain-containing protein n=1 Tax=Lobosporangium transversale TaxID=64571 RepID=A0A1Y2H387_9FUNG|nr:hypothetical protein BCR41DRAFT_418101 [Lobosporangium transversale]KAF9901715.1 hypothetical protein BX616_002173 [Lobosporangium transversale]ORZ29018.1 hypothetical protein BCR41DRAFT_418101 [Lobosporangium transversale]|eukprot:XP_021886691.1 hypothetical protein BCR41DRAFT_418101 [Lobosporangium transversale]
MASTLNAQDTHEVKDEYSPEPIFKSFKSSELPPQISNSPPHVIISGGGLAGLFLANILEKANIPYQIFERAKEVVPLGSVMSLTANILPAFEQLGLYEDLRKISFTCSMTRIFSHDMKKIGEYSCEEDNKIVGYESALFPRPELYKLLYDRIPPHKIQMGKKVMSFLQNQEGVMVRLKDGTCVHGDILVGADGAYSAVRQNLFKELSEQKKLPSSDEREISKGYICLVGTTNALDPSKYPGLGGPTCDSNLMVGDKSTPYAWSVIQVPGNRICWGAVLQLTADASADEQFRNSEWTSAHNKKMIERVYHFKTPYGILGDLIDATPKDLISRVFLEDILYETWHHGRTVLIGDAAHKMLPSAGQGAINAMQDAVVLANCLYDLKPLSFGRIQKAFKSYHAQRYHHVKTQYEASQIAAKLQYGHTMFERLFRHVVFHYLPKSVQKSRVVKDSQYRPQIAFLPPPLKHEISPVNSQKPSRKHKEEEQAVPS